MLGVFRESGRIDKSAIGINNTEAAHRSKQMSQALKHGLSTGICHIFKAGYINSDSFVVLAVSLALSLFAACATPPSPARSRDEILRARRDLSFEESWDKPPKLISFPIMQAIGRAGDKRK